jgi:lysophospholipase L1-like esterase
MKFLVVIIPTKESVYARYIEGNKSLPASEKIDRLIANEREVNAEVKRYFNEHGIAYVDVLDALREKAGSEQLYPANFGGHTNGNGYRIIAETVNSWLEKAQ